MLLFIKQFKIILSILLIVSLVGMFAEDIPLSVKTFAYTLSHVIRQILLFLLPFLIFPFIVTSTSTLKTQGAYLISTILIMVTLSNFVAIMIPYFVGQVGIPLLKIPADYEIYQAQKLDTLVDFQLEPWLQIEYTMVIALVLGLGIGLSRTIILDKFFHHYEHLAKRFFTHIFMPTLPVYVVGTVIKIAHEMDFKPLISMFSGMVILIVGTQLTYIAFLYYLGSGMSLKRTWVSIKNVLPSGIVGLSTMSSMVTLPLTLKAAEKNLPEDPDGARVTVTTTVNCHTVGECLSLPLIALTLYYMTHGVFPQLDTYIVFAFFVAIAQFGGVSIPGGSIIIILPFLVKDLGFSNEMCSMIMALSIFLDPVGTAHNVLGNGAFAMLVYRVQTMFIRRVSTVRQPATHYALSMSTKRYGCYLKEKLKAGLIARSKS